MDKPIRVVLIGAGQRSELYGKYALSHPDEMQVVGVADPNPVRRKHFQALFSIPECNLFESAEALCRHEKIADAAVNGTMDILHVPVSVLLMRAGYDVLLEKPFALNEEEMWELNRVHKETGRKLMVCHVLRYSYFYQAIQKLIAEGAIGRILSIEASEYVSYRHVATSYVRGKWNNSDVCHSGMLLAKSCHDLDILMWLKGTEPEAISSFGSLMYFKRENAPEGAADRCLCDCPYLDSCDYSAKKMYIDNPDRWKFLVWTELEGKEDVSDQDKLQLLKDSSPFGRCIFKCDNNVVDHQTISIVFKDGATASMNMIAASAMDDRTIHIIGTGAEIFGSFSSGQFTMRAVSPLAPGGYEETVFNPMQGHGGETHGGGDDKLMADFLRYISGEPTSSSLTSLETSINGHLAVFLAEKSRETGKTQYFEKQ